MKCLLIILFLCPSCIIAQSCYDSLTRYGYHIFGNRLVPHTNDSMIEMKMFGGSGFFIRKNSRLFLITSKHVLSGCGENDKDPFQPDEMSIWVSNDNNPKVLRLDVKKIKDTSSCLPMPLSPDIIVIEVKDTIAANVYSVEKYISSPYKKLHNSFIVGYPGIGGELAGLGLQYRAPSKIKLEYNTYSIVGQYTDSSMTKLDSINYYVFSDKIDFKENFKGYSGSPFFVQDKKTKEWRIAGILVGQVYTNKNTYGITVCNIEFALIDVNRL